jgi:hypothetical protein
MFKKTMKFDDLDGKPVEQTFYFNYNKKEIAELLELGYVSQFRPDDVSSRLPLEKQLEILQTPVSDSGLSEKENTQLAYDIFQDLLLDAYGEKGADNVTFYKDEKTRRYFQNHVAYIELIFEFIGDPKLAGQFIEGCLPPRFVAEAKAELARKEASGENDLGALVAEAERRQQDPATRIEPGPEAAREALGENKPVETLAGTVVDGGTGPNKPIEELTEEDIMTMDAEDFKNLDTKRLSHSQLQVAFRRKMQS